MGISYSKLNKSNDCEMIDFIASHYIFTMNFNSLKKLFEKEYCNELILTVSNIIINYLNDNEIIIIAKRIKTYSCFNEIFILIEVGGFIFCFSIIFLPCTY